MKSLFAIALLLLATDAHARTKPDKALCAEVRTFLSSVQPDDTRAITFRTYWGARKDGERTVIGSQSCEHHGYGPGERLCGHLMENSSLEVPGYNARRILNCLMPKPGIDAGLDIRSGAFLTTSGSPDRGALVELELSPDEATGITTMVLRADGY